jgi:uncharacterized protein YidB (DUF937 family)
MDPLWDLVQRLRVAIATDGALSEQRISQIEQRVRQEWAGDRAYMRKRQPVSSEQLRSEFTAGTSVRDIARHHGMSRRGVYKRLQGG